MHTLSITTITTTTTLTLLNLSQYTTHNAHLTTHNTSHCTLFTPYATGEMIKKLRNEQLTGTNSSKVGLWAANNFSLINNSVPTLLNTVNIAHKVGLVGQTWVRV